MRKLVHLILLFIAFVLVSCNSEKVKDDVVEDEVSTEEMQAYLDKAKMYFAALPVVAENPDNPLTEAKIKLGKILYYDTRLSKEGNISCNTCHNLETYGVDNLPVSPGDDGTLGTRNSPTVLNAALHSMQFWDGRAKDVEEQAGMPITNPIEMAMTDEEFVINRIKEIDLYQQLFANAFPEVDNPISYENLGKAIGAFERILITPSRFDEFINEKFDALSIEELNGMEAFINSGCIACHRGDNLGGNLFQKFALFGDYWEYTGSEVIDKGKFEETQQAGDEFIFKVPGLRNIEYTYPYFHDGSVEDLANAIQIMSITEMGKELSEEDVNQILVFLKSLSADVSDEVKKIPIELEGA